MVKLFRALVFQHRLKKQIRIGGRPLCVSKKRIRTLISEQVYRRGVKVADIAAIAIYKTK